MDSSQADRDAKTKSQQGVKVSEIFSEQAAQGKKNGSRAIGGWNAVTPGLRLALTLPCIILWIWSVSSASETFQEFEIELPFLSVLLIRTARFGMQFWPIGVLATGVFTVADFVFCLRLKSHPIRIVWEILTWSTPFFVILVTFIGILMPLMALMRNLAHF